VGTFSEEGPSTPAPIISAGKNLKSIAKFLGISSLNLLKAPADLIVG
jgi:hypothetical protein